MQEQTGYRHELIAVACSVDHARLKRAIFYCDRRAEDLKAQKRAGKQPRMNPQRAG